VDVPPFEIGTSDDRVSEIQTTMTLATILTAAAAAAPAAATNSAEQ